jgi:hypothetical protein
MPEEYFALLDCIIKLSISSSIPRMSSRHEETHSKCQCFKLQLHYGELSALWKDKIFFLFPAEFLNLDKNTSKFFIDGY